MHEHLSSRILTDDKIILSLCDMNTLRAQDARGNTMNAERVLRRKIYVVWFTVGAELSYMRLLPFLTFVTHAHREVVGFLYASTPAQAREWGMDDFRK